MCRSIFQTLEPRRLFSGLPSITIGDLSVTEGNAGNTTAEVVVSLSKPRPRQPVTVNYATQNGTAAAGADYAASSGVVTFAVGETSKKILLPVTGDRTAESGENFVVNLQNAKQAKIADGQAIITIVDDEPRISITGASGSEGNSGTTPFTFTVSLSAAYDQAVTVNFATQDYTAFAGVDYLADSGMITFAAGDTTKTVTVQGLGNTTPEAEKYFLVNLSGASTNAQIASGAAYGSIADDDGYVDPYYYDPGYYYDYGYYDYGWYGYYDSYYWY